MAMPSILRNAGPVTEKRSFADNVGPGANAEIVLPVFATLVIVFRIWLRRKFNINLWWDDVTIIIAQPLMYVFYYFWWYTCTFIIWDKRISELTGEAKRKVLMTNFILLILYSISNFFVKSSAILLFWRAFSNGTGKGVRWGLYALFAVNTGIFLNRILGSTVFCIPTSAFWNDPSKCSPQITTWSITSESLSVVFEAALLIFPIPIIWKMRNSTTRAKLTIYAAFATGIMMIMCHAARLTMLKLSKYIIPKALSDAALPALAFLSLLEHTLATTSVCLPAMYSPLRKFIRQIRRRPGNLNDGDSQHESPTPQIATPPPTAAPSATSEERRDSAPFRTSTEFGSVSSLDAKYDLTIEKHFGE